MFSHFTENAPMESKDNSDSHSRSSKDGGWRHQLCATEGPQAKQLLTLMLAHFEKTSLGSCLLTSLFTCGLAHTASLLLLQKKKNHTHTKLCLGWGVENSSVWCRVGKVLKGWIKIPISETFKTKGNAHEKLRREQLTGWILAHKPLQLTGRGLNGCNKLL